MQGSGGRVESIGSGLIWEFPKMKGTFFGVLIMGILLFRVLFLGSPIFGNPHMAQAFTCIFARTTQVLEVLASRAECGVCASVVHHRSLTLVYKLKP